MTWASPAIQRYYARPGWADPAGERYYGGLTMLIGDDGLAAYTDLRSAEKDIADLKEQVKDAVARKRDAESRLRSALQDAADGQGRLPLAPFEKVTVTNNATRETVDVTEQFNTGKPLTSDQAAKLNANKPAKGRKVAAGVR